ncbi:family 2 encapsulin nanocompartment cargo protein polyprenyl transferase [Sphaerisporangium sp. NBC_01403]|uniref:family 2 encapsulin nanocompartment cargo protein polyprenyl transferase n=1 Tax=Sphaerisporangium sp. NBC_01403 TaxID=2903599 RepID=UPI00324BBCD9
MTKVMTTGRPAHEVLAWSRDLAGPALRSAVETLPASMRRIAGYHFGWQDEHGHPTTGSGSGGGKAIRPALVLLSAEAVGVPTGTPSAVPAGPGGPVGSAIGPSGPNGSSSSGTSGTSGASGDHGGSGGAGGAGLGAALGAPGGLNLGAMSAAVAVELVHNFSLLHDDVMDGDVTRRHRPTAWSVFGVSAAILAGDALLTLAFDVLGADGHPAAPDGARVLGAAVLDLVEGQSADTAFEARAEVSLPECVSMAEGKTGALLGGACALGALFGGGTPEQIEHLRGFGDRLGLAFQLVDDLLGIWGDPAVTGKPVYSDLRNRKKSLPVVAALASGTPAGDELAALYRRDQELTGPDLVHAAELIEAAGGRAWSQSRADDLLVEALGHLTSADPVPRAATELTTLAHLVTHRDH